MKEYFSHDYNPRADKKIRRLLAKHGMTGYGVYWCLVEDLYQNDNKMPTDFEMYAIEMRVDAKMIQWIICDSELFKVKENHFSSDSVSKRIKLRKEKSEVAKNNANLRWGSKKGAKQTQYNGNATALQDGCKPNANKSKVKENINTTTTTTTTETADAFVVDEVDNIDFEIQDYFKVNVPKGADPAKEADIFIKMNDIKNWAAAGGRQNWRKVADLYIRKIKVKKNGNNKRIGFTEAVSNW